MVPAVFACDDECAEVLVDGVGFVAERLDGVLCGWEEASFAEDVGLPAAFDHRPVGVVAVHGDEHASAAGGDAGIAALGLQGLEELLEGQDILQGGGLADVASVQEDMNADALDALGGGVLHHRLEVVDVGMDIAVGEESDEMQRGVVAEDIGGNFLPAGVLEHLAVGDGVGDQLGALVEDASGAHGVVSDLGVAHVGVGGQSDRHAVGL